MVYLNSQLISKGATEFVDAPLSSKFSMATGYMGLKDQRKEYNRYACLAASKLSLDCEDSSLQHFTFSPHEAGHGVLFYPTRSLHRGVGPVQGARYILSFSMTPIPSNCNIGIDESVGRPALILQDKIKQGRAKCDAIPFWVYD